MSLGTNNPVLSASAASYGNTNYMLDGVRHGTGYGIIGITEDVDYSGGAPYVSNAITVLVAAGAGYTGFQVTFNGQAVDYTLTQAAPEPSALGLLAMGGVLFLIAVRESRKSTD